MTQLERHAWLWTIGFVGLNAAYHLGMGEVLRAAGITAELPYLLINKILLALLLVLALHRLGLWRALGFRAPKGWLWPVMAWPALLPSLPLLFLAVGTYDEAPFAALGYTIVAAAVGFGEEVVFRGVVLQALRGRGVIFAAAISSLLFGALHLLALVRNPDEIIFFIQAFMAAGLGMLFAGLTVRYRSIWPAIFIHVFVDAVSFIARGGVRESLNTFDLTFEVTVGLIAAGVFFAGWGLFLLILETSRGSFFAIDEGERPAAAL